MVYHLLANLTILVHFAFLLFVVLGGFVSHRYRRLTPLHLLALAWGIYVEAMPGLRCPLTALENSFAVRAGVLSGSIALPQKAEALPRQSSAGRVRLTDPWNLKPPSSPGRRFAARSTRSSD